MAVTASTTYGCIPATRSLCRTKLFARLHCAECWIGPRYSHKSHLEQQPSTYCTKAPVARRPEAVSITRYPTGFDAGSLQQGGSFLAKEPPCIDSALDRNFPALLIRAPPLRHRLGVVKDVSGLGVELEFAIYEVRNVRKQQHRNRDVRNFNWRV